jgi:hypothetical protein
MESRRFKGGGPAVESHRVPQGHVSGAARAVTAFSLFVLGVWVILRWSGSCGTLAEDYTGVPATGRACGVTKSGAQLLLPVAGLVPLALARPRSYYCAVAALLIAFLGVALVLGPSS